MLLDIDIQVLIVKLKCINTAQNGVPIVCIGLVTAWLVEGLPGFGAI